MFKNKHLLDVEIFQGDTKEVSGVELMTYIFRYFNHCFSK